MKCKACLQQFMAPETWHIRNLIVNHCQSELGPPKQQTFRQWHWERQRNLLKFTQLQSWRDLIGSRHSINVYTYLWLYEHILFIIISLIIWAYTVYNYVIYPVILCSICGQSLHSYIRLIIDGPELELELSYYLYIYINFFVLTCLNILTYLKYILDSSRS